MGWNKATLKALDKAINSLEFSISNLDDNTLKSDLETKLQKLRETRNSMTEKKRMTNFYLVLLPVLFLFVSLGFFYFTFKKRSSIS